MTASELARSYLAKATVRLKALELFMQEEAWSDVLREAQELVELALKAMLRQVGLDPPKWHDVGPILLNEAALFPEPIRQELDQLAEISAELRKERERAFYGDIEFIPTREYTREDAQEALDAARKVLVVARRLIQA